MPGSSRGRLGSFGFRQPLGRCSRRQGARRAEQQARHRYRKAHLQGVPRPARLTALAAHLQRRRPSATPAVGQHGNQGSEGLRCPLYQGAGCAFHGEHDARGNIESPRRSRRFERNHVGRWRRLRSGIGTVRQGRHRHRCLGRKAPGRRRQVVRQFLERTHGCNRFQERRPLRRPARAASDEK